MVRKQVVDIKSGSGFGKKNPGQTKVKNKNYGQKLYWKNPGHKI